jgi:ribosomal protein S18 acetylase RimI-like enzyme
MDLRELGDTDRPWFRALVEREWGLPVVSTSGAHDPCAFPGFVAYDGDNRVGAVTYRSDGDALEVLTMDALTPGVGVGTALLAAAKKVADLRHERLWLLTTNDNIRAIAFYQRRGMDMVALHRNFFDDVCRYKPSLIQATTEGIPFRHALELSY